jgi:hypothetical protein
VKTADELAAELVSVGKERQEARAQALDASTRIRVLAQEALGAGIGKSEIARLAQISRQALDTMLGHPN